MAPGRAQGPRQSSWGVKALLCGLLREGGGSWESPRRSVAASLEGTARITQPAANVDARQARRIGIFLLGQQLIDGPLFRVRAPYGRAEAQVARPFVVRHSVAVALRSRRGVDR